MANNDGNSYQAGTTAAPQKARAVLQAITPQVQGGFTDNSILSTTLPNQNANVTYLSKQTGLGGNAITVTHVAAGANTPLSVSVTGNAITVNLATNAGSVPTSTAAQVVAAVNANGPASALVTASLAFNRTGNDGTGTAAAMTASSLTGGKVAFQGGRSNAPTPTQPPIHNHYA